MKITKGWIMEKAKAEAGQNIEAGRPLTIRDLGYSDYELAHIALLIRAGDKEPVYWKDDGYYFTQAIKFLLAAREFRQRLKNKVVGETTEEDRPKE